MHAEIHNKLKLAYLMLSDAKKLIGTMSDLGQQLELINEDIDRLQYEIERGGYDAHGGHV